MLWNSSAIVLYVLTRANTASNSSSTLLCWMNSRIKAQGSRSPMSLKNVIIWEKYWVSTVCYKAKSNCHIIPAMLSVVGLRINAMVLHIYKEKVRLHVGSPWAFKLLICIIQFILRLGIKLVFYFCTISTLLAGFSPSFTWPIYLGLVIPSWQEKIRGLMAQIFSLHDINSFTF